MKDQEEDVGGWGWKQSGWRKNPVGEWNFIAKISNRGKRWKEPNYVIWIVCS